MKHFLTTILFLLLAFGLRATHNRAGEITYRWKSGRTYDVTITTYTRSTVQADRCELELFWGDGTSTSLNRVNGPPGCDNGGRGEIIAPDIKRNIYEGTHTYLADGSYILYFEDPNRNAGVRNILQSVTVPFYVQSELVISAGFGPNNSPVLTNEPIDDGCVGQRFEHSAGAYNNDKDSLSYRLVDCRTSGGMSITTTYDPNFVKDSVKIDPYSGLLVWDSPREIGEYNFAFEISEWRKNSAGQFVKIGYVVRDMQVTINNCEEKQNDVLMINEPPELDSLGPFCVKAGETISFTVTAVDSQFTSTYVRNSSGEIIDTVEAKVADPITLTAFGGPFVVSNPATFPEVTGVGTVSSQFEWVTNCENVRKQPYYATFSAKDDPSARNATFTPLVDLFSVEITVVAPGPENPLAVPNGDVINLSWDPSICTDDVVGYDIYRRESSYGFVPDQCETGVPEYTGYRYIGSTPDLNTTNYTDTSQLLRGVEYCYMVVVTFSDGAESYASEEFCAALELNAPMMTNVDVISTDPSTGEIEVKWIAPPVLDSVQFPGPYSYKLFRSQGIGGTEYSEIATLNGGLNDTFYSDQNLNTEDVGWRYKVELYYGPDSKLLAPSDPASSVFLNISPVDKANVLRASHNTPWRNSSFIVFREEPTGSNNFEILDTSFTAVYVDTGLVNGENYCYYIRAIGAYTASDSLPAPLINHSQINCAAPLDTTAPCSPLVSGDYNCEGDYLRISWEQPADSGCADVIVAYNIYYKSTIDGEYTEPLATVTNGNSFEIQNETVVGCYAVTAVDDAGSDPNGSPNESAFSLDFCVEPCPQIDFPNVFTPNSDGINDFFTSEGARNIAELRMEIFNRWGVKVYESLSPEDFFSNGWDGTDMNTGEKCADGVYYYVCIYSPLSLSVATQQEASGFVHLLRSNK